MDLTINNQRNFQKINFKAQKNRQEQNENPITRKGEAAKLVLGTFTVGLSFGAKALFEVFDGDFIYDVFFKSGQRIADKNFKNAKEGKRFAAMLGATIGLVGLFVAGVASIYTLFSAPKISYQSKVKTFEKTKEFDTYIKTNEIEKSLYDQINSKAKQATNEEKEELKNQYLILKQAKNQTPINK